MKDLIVIAAIIAAWILLQGYVLPKLGITT
jgi:hypothetical protein